jgi:cell division transport system permease protein
VGDIAAFPEVASVRYVSDVQALERARRELGEFEDVFEAGILPASIEVRLREGQRDPESVRSVARRLEFYDFIDDIRYGEEWVEKLYKIRNIATAVGLSLGVIFAIVAIIIIGSTIRMAVLARSREIHIMRLVGATNGFIRAPFLVEGFLKGFLGGLLALVLTYFSFEFVGQYVVEATYFGSGLAVLGVLAGAMIGLLGSAVSVGTSPAAGVSGVRAARASKRAVRTVLWTVLCAALCAVSSATTASAQTKAALPPSAAQAAERLRQEQLELERLRTERQELEQRMRRLQSNARDVAEEKQNIERQAAATSRVVPLTRRAARIVGRRVVDNVNTSLARTQDELIIKRATLRNGACRRSTSAGHCTASKRCSRRSRSGRSWRATSICTWSRSVTARW